MFATLLARHNIKVSTDDFDLQSIQNDDDAIYLLLHPINIERCTRKVIQPDDNTIPPNLGLLTQLKEIEPFIYYQWLWEDTKYDYKREKGPLLINVSHSHDIVRHFVSQWAKCNGGLIIISSSSLKEICWHLSKFSTLYTHKSNVIHLNWYPNNLSLIIGCLIASKRQRLLGSINSITWCENLYNKVSWYLYNQVVDKPSLKDLSFFKLTHRELKYISILEEYRFQLSLEELINHAKKTLTRRTEQCQKIHDIFRLLGIYKYNMITTIVSVFLDDSSESDEQIELYCSILAEVTISPENRLDAIMKIRTSKKSFLNSNYFNELLVRDWLTLQKHQGKNFGDAVDVVLNFIPSMKDNLSLYHIREHFLLVCQSSPEQAWEVLELNSPSPMIKKQVGVVIGECIYGE
ncbi:hypothetical protein AW119_27935 [Escherichia coli]|uniref:hypothetical protein n=1 Tax=Escherichia coli TaxID=562 RepID=UPI000A2EBF5B|nr:hypothetical protein [Escherichia coli]EFK1742632.1 hypothetical protein [Escherichia coli]OTD28401.1 hypothetical protein AW095_27490 [Escherichia coli]OTE44549.1 hypothetical protein AW119_27935 [Escherichia coli]TJQ41397.1 hypothetical protein C9Z62_25070 [Escherichia coli]